MAAASKEDRSTPPGRVYVPDHEWQMLGDSERQFIIEAEAGGMRYLAEDGRVCAWGVAYEGLFSMDISVDSHPEDGYLVTVREA